MTLSQYLGRGSTSRGRMTITPNLDTVVSTLPYLNDPHDKEAVIQGIMNVQSALSKVANLTYTYPNSTQTAKEFIDTVCLSSFRLHDARAVLLLGGCISPACMGFPI